MQSRPSAAELLDAIQDLLIKQILPKVEGEGALAYKTLVSWNMLGVVARELRSGEALVDAELQRLASILGLSLPSLPTLNDKHALAREWNTKLAQRIRKEKITDDPAVLDHVKKTLSETLSITNPRFSTEG
ncbi:MAG: hypothetical protein HY042_06710 [Spirochaetia bacterium]|nr:hypothetical protein [Spirochaetia bacterium]